jgi:4-hydroxy-3-methylbut-2-en-1-yl diphosphate reductase
MKTNIKKIYVASPMGFCAGVKRAVAIVDLLLKKYGPPIYVKHQIVHNRHVVSDFEKKGVIFVENVKDIPNKARVIFSAHGSPPEDYQLAKIKQLQLFDATCPLVRKVHLEAKRYAKEGYFIIYIGHKGHQEAKGVLGEIDASISTLISSIDEAQRLTIPNTKKIVVLTQTTLSFDDTKNIIECLKKRFPRMITPPVFDICYSTQNRQNAVKELAKKTQLIFVIGSQESSNSKQLQKTAEKAGTKAYLINDISEINQAWLKKIENLGITAGASVPENLINKTVKYFVNPQTKIEKSMIIKENINFPLPKEVYENT